MKKYLVFLFLALFLAGFVPSASAEMITFDVWDTDQQTPPANPIVTLNYDLYWIHTAITDCTEGGGCFNPTYNDYAINNNFYSPLTFASSINHYLTNTTIPSDVQTFGLSGMSIKNEIYVFGGYTLAPAERIKFKGYKIVTDNGTDTTVTSEEIAIFADNYNGFEGFTFDDEWWSQGLYAVEIYQMILNEQNVWVEVAPGNPGSGSFGIDNIDLSFDDNRNTPVPEPCTMILLGTGIIGLGWSRRRKNA